MKLVVFGATGSVGRKLVEQGLEEGHEITAFVRTPDKLAVAHPNLSLVQGDVLDYAAVREAVRGQEAVLCALGAGRKGAVRAAGTQNIIRAMEEEPHSPRLVCQTTLGVGDSRGNLNFFWKHVMFGMLLAPAYADHVRQEEYIKKSRLDWTIVRPGAFIDGRRTGSYRHGFGPQDRSTCLKISRADVADFMLKQLNDPTYRHRAPGLSY